MRATDRNSIDLTVLEMIILSTLGFIAIINDGEVWEIIGERL